jgi:hypothetical protein
MWVPPSTAVKAGYIPKSLTLDPHASQLEIAETCRRQWRDLEDWRSGRPKPVKMTIGWLIDRYLNDPTSPFQRVKPDTQQSYRWECKRIRDTVGDMRLDPKMDNGILVPRRTGEDFRKWFHNWGHPQKGRPTPSRATHCIAMLRILIGYYVAIGGLGAVQLRDILSEMRFEKPPARGQSITREQVNALVTKAEELGFRSIAIATLAQYELIERRAHIIGQWYGGTWDDGWRWECVSPDWVISYYQTKKGRRLRQYDLKPIQRLLGMMQATPRELRKGPIIICETSGLPWVKRRYQQTFRKIARAAGVPDDVFSMDMRSGGATEADSIHGISDRMLQDSGGWQDPKMAHRYRRRTQDNAQKVLELRQATRNRS